MNEYEFYPNGDSHYEPLADRWGMRIARWIKGSAPHGHIVSLHNGPVAPPFAKRFRTDPGAVDAIMFQTWGTIGQADGWLAAGIEERIAASFEGWWGPWMLLESDQAGMAYLLVLRRFLREVVPFPRLRPAPALLHPLAPGVPPGYEPRALATPEADVVALYFPAGGQAGLQLPAGRAYQGEWFDPRTGHRQPAAAVQAAVSAPAGADDAGHPLDWVLILTGQC